jgi:hypothetical protein
MLNPMGIIPKEAWIREAWTPRNDYPEWVTNAASPCVIVGELVYRKTPIFSPDGCLPDSVGSLLLTDRGIRRLLPEELAKAKGVPGDWISHDLLQTRDINHMTTVSTYGRPLLPA